jgi:hypothetical protein
LRALYLVDSKGPVVRWANSSEILRQRQGLFYHDHLDNGEGGDNARAGYVVRKAGTRFLMAQ